MNEFIERAIPSPSGGKTWYSSAGNSIEENVMAYEGHLVYNRHNEGINKGKYKGGTKWRDKSEWIIHKDSHKRCLSEDVAKKITMQISYIFWETDCAPVSKGM